MISTELKKRFITSIVLLPIGLFIIIYSRILFLLLLIFITFFSFQEWFNLNKKKISLTLLSGFVFILLSIISAYFLRGDDRESIIFFLWILSICILSDIGGYFSGKIIGGKKLISISPNKTYAGFFGSLLFSVIPIFAFYFYDISHARINLSIETVFLSLFFSLISQIGDVTVSYFKRLKKIKDSGSLLPGHGGLLDRLDGIFFVIFFSYLLKITNII